jgi:hypothetical protein
VTSKTHAAVARVRKRIRPPIGFVTTPREELTLKVPMGTSRGDGYNARRTTNTGAPWLRRGRFSG